MATGIGGMVPRRPEARLPRPIRSALVLGGGLILAALTIQVSLAPAVGRTDPELGSRINPWDARLLAARATRLMDRIEDPAAQRTAAGLAAQALRRDATIVSGIRTLALVSDAQGRTGEARRLFRRVEMTSRRDLPTQLWLIEDAVRRNDVAGALGHYDTALRISRKSWDLLFPVLVGATSDPSLLRPLEDLLRTRPIWAPSFIQTLAQTGTAWPNAAALLVSLGRRGQLNAGDAAGFISRAVEAGEFGAAWRVYESVHSGVDRARVRHASFATSAADQPFDWQLSSDAAIAVDMGADGLHASAPSGTGGNAASQLLLLAPGRYRLVTEGAEAPQPEPSRSLWAVTCNRAEADLVRLPLPQQPRDRAAAEFTVAADCPAQWLHLVLRPSDIPSGVDATIRRVDVVPVATSKGA